MRPRRIPVAIYLLVSLAFPAVASAEDDKGDKDKSKPIRHELEQVYAELADAMEKKDVEAILAFNHPDVRSEDCQGRTYSPEVTGTRTRGIVSRTHPPIDATFSLGVIDLNGDDEAVVTVRRSLSSMQRMNDGKLRKVDTIQTDDETWVRTPEGWRLRLLQNIREFEWYVDGKRVGKGMPYDPDAPPYEPPTEG